MDPSGVDSAVNLATAAVIIIGIFGTVIPHVAGLSLCWLAVAGWAVLTPGGEPQKWVTVGIVTALTVVGSIVKYLAPGRKLRREGVPRRTLLAGGVLGIIGFCAIPVVGLFIGFVLGVFLAELARLDSAKLAWPSTWGAVKAVGLSMLIEILFGFAILGVWLWTVLVVL